MVTVRHSIVTSQRGHFAPARTQSLPHFERDAVEVTPGGQPVDSLLAETTAAPTMSLVLVLSADVLDLLPAPADGELTRVTAPDTPHGETATVVTAVVRNTDALAAYFYVSLVNCTPGVSPAGRVTAMPLGAGDAGTTVFAWGAATGKAQPAVRRG